LTQAFLLYVKESSVTISLISPGELEVDFSILTLKNQGFCAARKLQNLLYLFFAW